MAEWLKQSRGGEARTQNDRKVRDTVETILADIEARGEAALRDYSSRFDGLVRDDFRLSPAEIEACIARLTPQELRDIEFAQAQVRNFAEKQKASLQEL